MNPTLIVTLTPREAKKEGITLPVTRAFPLGSASYETVYAPVIRDMERGSIPYAIVNEGMRDGHQQAAVWRGKPPKPKRTAHEFRAQLYRDPIRNPKLPTP